MVQRTREQVGKHGQGEIEIDGRKVVASWWMTFEQEYIGEVEGVKRNRRWTILCDDAAGIAKRLPKHGFVLVIDGMECERAYYHRPVVDAADEWTVTGFTLADWPADSHPS